MKNEKLIESILTTRKKRNKSEILGYQHKIEAPKPLWRKDVVFYDPYADPTSVLRS